MSLRGFMEAKFVISTDSTCDLYADEIKELGVWVVPMTFTLEKDDVITEHLDNFKTEQEYIDFYNKLREGYVAKTSILGLQAHIDLFTAMAKAGVKHALHICLSYGLSHILDNANKAIEIVKESYPTIDYLALECATATVGEGACVRYACKLRDEGKTNVEVYDAINAMKHKIQHFIVVDNLMYLKRGGRISAASATVGTLLQIKPIIQFTRKGSLETAHKVFGVKKALKDIVERYGTFHRFEPYDKCVIVHTDNLPAATELQKMMNAEYGFEPPIRWVGPVIGAHLGPGAVAMEFTSRDSRPIV